MNTSDAFNALKTALQQHPKYAWTWHCNIAMSHYDAMREAGLAGNEVTHKIANKYAANFMKLCFDVDMKENPDFKALFGDDSTEVNKNAIE